VGQARPEAAGTPRAHAGAPRADARGRRPPGAPASPPELKPDARRSIEEYVRPLAAGLDGVTNFGDVARVAAASERIAFNRDGLDHDLLFLLAVFSGQERWISRLGNASRTEIFLGTQGVPARTIRSLLKGLARFEQGPVTSEEEIVHDAVLLERMGAYGIVQLLAEGYRERSDFLEIARAIEQAASQPLRTEAGERLAASRRATMLAFARDLRAEHGEFRGSR
jgi:hypothetical protein